MWVLVSWTYRLSFRWTVAGLLPVFLAALVWNSARTSPSSVERLLAQAYDEHRTLELRIPGARYSPLRVERGAADAIRNRSLTLIEAELSIRKHLDRGRPNPEWLQAKARLDLLQDRPDDAIHSLHQALDITPASPSLLTDLASGYIERAESDDQALDYGDAIESLGEVLAKDPDNQVALFNRAIACERMFLYRQALEDWTHYLALDKTSGWVDEARNRLSALQRKVTEREERTSTPLLSAAQVAELSSKEDSLDVLEPRIEEYLLTAITDWLPAGYPLSRRRHGQMAATKSALRALAEWTANNHKDPWLMDLLSSSASQNFPAAVNALSETLKANDEGNTWVAQRLALQAVTLFRSENNAAGESRAWLEYIYASHIAQEGSVCLQSATHLAGSRASFRYPWLRSQLGLEEGTCFWLTGNMGKARSLYEQSGRLAQRSGYNSVYLRSQDHLASLDGTTGNFKGSWQRIRGALSIFWAGSYPPMRGYNLYYHLEESARIRKEPHLQMSSWSAGLQLSDSFADPSLRAMAHSLMADAAIAAGEEQVAERELGRAEHFFDRSPQIHSTRVAQLEAETRWAEAEIGLGRLSQAEQRLRQIGPKIAELSDNFLSVLYYTDMGDAEARLRKESEAGIALQSAILFAEQDLGSLEDERSRLEWSENSSSAYRTMVELKLDAEDVGGALELYEWYRGAGLRSHAQLGNRTEQPTGIVHGYSALGTTSKPNTAMTLPRLHEVKDHLRFLKKETVIAYARLPEGFVAWVYDDRGISFYKINAPPTKIASLARSFRRLCSNPDSNVATIRQEGQALYGLLITPVLDSLAPDRGLIIEADDELTGIPFEALVDANGRYLADRTALTNSLGLYYYDRLRPALPLTSASPALIAAVSVTKADAHQALPVLPQAKEEAERVARDFRSPIVLLGKEASLTATRKRLSNAVVFHFAGHAIASARESGLLLSDAALTYETLRGVSLNRMQLAVLSGCDTLGGLENGTYDPDSLVRLFVSAGVPHFVASRWMVDSVATSKFMQVFYAALTRGKSVSAALADSRTELRTGGDTHPYYWAAFTQFGVN